MPVLLFFLCHCNSTVPQLVVINGNTMGTTYTIKIVTQSPADEQVLHQGIQAVVDRINNAMSNWIPNSDVSKFGSLNPGSFLQVSKDTQNVLELAIEIARKTDGAFDPTVSPLIELWGFGTKERDHFPTDAEIEQLLAKTGYQKLLFQDGKTAKTHAGLQLNLGAIAKGYALDQVALFLDASGYQNYLIDIGRELRANGTNLKGEPWRVAIENPDPEVDSPILRVVSLKNKSIATSGDYRQFFEYQGNQYSHILDPRTGRPIPPNITLASVVAKDCANADGWATALMVLPVDKGIALVEAEPELECLLVQRLENGIFSIHMSSGFEDLLLENFH